MLIHESGELACAARNANNNAFRRPRDIEMCIEVNLTEAPKASPTPWDEIELGPAEASEYRAASARLNYSALDRPDIVFASKECSRRMSSPRTRVV